MLFEETWLMDEYPQQKTNWAQPKDGWRPGLYAEQQYQSP
jgi:hypothetical protein